jgi:hypothetical protein
MFLRAGLLSTLLALAGPAAAEPALRAWADESWLTGMEFGLWCLPVTPDGVSESPETIIGETDRYDVMPDLVVRTHTVPLASEVTFGVRAKFARSNWADLPLKAVLIHPAPQGTVPQMESWAVWPWDDGSFFNTYTFFDPARNEAGHWTFILSDGKRRLHEVVFDVVPPEAAPDLVGICGEAQVS